MRLPNIPAIKTMKSAQHTARSPFFASPPSVQNRQGRNGIPGRPFGVVGDTGFSPAIGSTLAIRDVCRAGEAGLFRCQFDGQRLVELGIASLPGTLEEALDELEKDEVVRTALGEHVYEAFMRAKRAEWNEYRIQVTDWELNRYLEAL